MTLSIHFLYIFCVIQLCVCSAVLEISSSSFTAWGHSVQRSSVSQRMSNIMKKWTCKRADFLMPSRLILLPALFAFPSSPRFYFLLLELYPKLPQNELLLKSFLIMRLVTQMNGALLNSHNAAQADSTFRCSLSELAFLSNNDFCLFSFCYWSSWPDTFKKSHSQKWMKSIRIKVKVNLTE